MDKIRLQRMEFYGYHGVFSEETKLGQQFYVDLTLHLDLKKSGESDDLNDTVNYAHIFQTTKKVVEGAPFRLIEALAENIATQLLGNYTKITELTVSVTKPHPPFDIHFAGVVVEIHRKRA